MYGIGVRSQRVAKSRQEGSPPSASKGQKLANVLAIRQGKASRESGGKLQSKERDEGYKSALDVKESGGVDREKAELGLKEKT